MILSVTYGANVKACRATEASGMGNHGPLFPRFRTETNDVRLTMVRYMIASGETLFPVRTCFFSQAYMVLALSNVESTGYKAEAARTGNDRPPRNVRQCRGSSSSGATAFPAATAPPTYLVLRCMLFTALLITPDSLRKSTAKPPMEMLKTD